MKANLLLKFLCNVCFVALLTNSNAQTWSFTNSGGAWLVPPACSLSFVPAAGSNTSTVTLNPYYSWSTIDYTLASANVFPTSPVNKTVSISVSNASANLAGKYLAVILYNGTNATSLSQSAIIAIPSGSATETASIDFAPLFNQPQVTKVSFIIYDNNLLGASAVMSSGSLTIAVNSFGAGVSGSSTITNATVAQDWTLNTNDALNNANKGNVLVGNFSSFGTNNALLNPYYQFVVNGRTNLIGTDNALNVFSSNLGTNGKRHYLGIGNYKYADNVTEYSLVNAGEYSSSGYNGKSLILQGNTGNVGIGTFTAAPVAKLTVNGKTAIGPRFITSTSAHTDYKLSVDGKIVCQSVYVLDPNGTDWADYVFAKGYKLRSLNSVEKYIQENQHLPNVPSAQEVEENGINTGEMLRIQMEKIEELTLYLIKMEKEMEVLKKKNIELEQMMK